MRDKKKLNQYPPTEEFLVKYWHKAPEEEFSSQKGMSFWYNSKNRHKQAEMDFIRVIRKLGGDYSIVSINYQ
jgi:hypothetical protein